MLCNTQERNSQLCLHLSLKMRFHLHCVLASFICISCPTATMCTHINIKVQPQVKRTAELWLLPQVSEDPGPCPSKLTVLNGHTLRQEFPSVQNYGEFLVSAHLTQKLSFKNILGRGKRYAKVAVDPDGFESWIVCKGNYCYETLAGEVYAIWLLQQ